MLVGAPGNDELDGGSGNDVISGGTGRDCVHGDFRLEAPSPGNDRCTVALATTIYVADPVTTASTVGAAAMRWLAIQTRISLRVHPGIN